MDSAEALPYLRACLRATAPGGVGRTAWTALRLTCVPLTMSYPTPAIALRITTRLQNAWDDTPLRVLLPPRPENSLVAITSPFIRGHCDADSSHQWRPCERAGGSEAPLDDDGGGGDDGDSDGMGNDNDDDVDDGDDGDGGHSRRRRAAHSGHDAAPPARAAFLLPGEQPEEIAVVNATASKRRRCEGSRSSKAPWRVERDEREIAAALAQECACAAPDVVWLAVEYNARPWRVPLTRAMFDSACDVVKRATMPPDTDAAVWPSPLLPAGRVCVERSVLIALPAKAQAAVKELQRCYAASLVAPSKARAATQLWPGLWSVVNAPDLRRIAAHHDAAAFVRRCGAAAAKELSSDLAVWIVWNACVGRWSLLAWLARRGAQRVRDTVALLTTTGEATTVAGAAADTGLVAHSFATLVALEPSINHAVQRLRTGVGAHVLESEVPQPLRRMIQCAGLLTTSHAGGRPLPVLDLAQTNATPVRVRLAEGMLASDHVCLRMVKWTDTLALAAELQTFATCAAEAKRPRVVCLGATPADAKQAEVLIDSLRVAAVLRGRVHALGSTGRWNAASTDAVLIFGVHRIVTPPGEQQLLATLSQLQAARALVVLVGDAWLARPVNGSVWGALSLELLGPDEERDPLRNRTELPFAAGVESADVLGMRQAARPPPGATIVCEDPLDPAWVGRIGFAPQVPLHLQTAGPLPDVWSRYALAAYRGCVKGAPPVTYTQKPVTYAARQRMEAVAAAAAASAVPA